MWDNKLIFVPAILIFVTVRNNEITNTWFDTNLLSYQPVTQTRKISVPRPLNSREDPFSEVPNSRFSISLISTHLILQGIWHEEFVLFFLFYSFSFLPFPTLREPLLPTIFWTFLDFPFPDESQGKRDRDVNFIRWFISLLSSSLYGITISSILIKNWSNEFTKNYLGKN